MNAINPYNTDSEHEQKIQGKWVGKSKASEHGQFVTMLENHVA